ncbi:sister chromatid cohesion 1 protein 1 isoform X5 [Coffea arabica]|uniref:Sister chromatid cohesion 1 protein 1 isoform X5 n=1 Tax=Coffea arabica TaxID=13443 RepID=A0ABM4WDK7_COFAR
MKPCLFSRVTLSLGGAFLLRIGVRWRSNSANPEHSRRTEKICCGVEIEEDHIGMAATTKEKITRKKLDKLDIIKICEEILNPSVPMALRLSSILMGGVVIVYERKVKLLYDDVNRLLVELNQAWKVQLVSDPTVLPKGKAQAKYESITLPAIREEDIEEMETLQHSNVPTTMGFTQTAYFSMRLDNMDDSYINPNPEEDLPQDDHQANPADITLFDSHDPSMADTIMHNRFERFDIEGDEDTQLNFAASEHATIPSTLVPSPPPQDKPYPSDEVQDHNPEAQVNQQVAKDKKVLQQDQLRQGPTRKRARQPAAMAMDCEQTIIPGHVYQSWLQNTSDITSRRRKNSQRSGAMSKRKIANITELPLTVLHDGLFTYGNREVHFPAPLLELWKKCTQPAHDSASGGTWTRQPPDPSSSSQPERIHKRDPIGYPIEDFHSGVGSQTEEISIEKQRTNHDISMQPEILMEEIGTDTANTKVPFSGAYIGALSQSNLMATPGDSSDEVRSIPSSGSGHGFLSNDSEVNLARSNMKRPHSSPRHRVYGLEPVAEENSSHPNFKLSRLSENGLIPDNELMVETGPTQTQKHPIAGQTNDQITRSIQMQLKAHFETPGSSEAESLNQLARGMDKKRAAALFLRTCDEAILLAVLATQDVIRVQQKKPYGDILISRGPKM